MHFTSPTRGIMTIHEMTENIRDYIQEDPHARYKLVIGTDSHTNRQGTVYVTALIIHRGGKGARLFYRKLRTKPMMDLRYRIYRETELSLEAVRLLNQNGINKLLLDSPVEIHADIGNNGDTKKLIQEIVGWITSIGYIVRIKPYSFGASSAADRFTN
ncbi:ribonuclease H-like YkuK family protein [Ferviditalea candida]|uniref:Ribonuclease H-like YkuK family protein n=1 Tax=Ferviditalea candida TaxID=3108399 RepID=A0ABU5ZIV7_9BACL|nr:ribonuclease H-like YkuK family protein [Paenibacillaceae bacterium T2]